MILFQIIFMCIFWTAIFSWASDYFDWGWDRRAELLAAVALCAILFAIRAALDNKAAQTASKQQQEQQQQQNVTVNIMLTDEQLEAELEKRKRGQG